MTRKPGKSVSAIQKLTIVFPIVTSIFDLQIVILDFSFVSGLSGSETEKKMI